MVRKTKLERVDMEMANLIDELVKTGLRRIDATKMIAKKYKRSKQQPQDYGGFI